jgi:hypothetical protein
MKKNRIIFTILASSLITASLISNVYASTESETPTVSENTEDETRGEVTEYHYMYIGNILYKRLWSVTRNCWVDPYWIPA